MNGYLDRLDTLLDGLHGHTGHDASFTRCLTADCRELRLLIIYSRVYWLDDEHPGPHHRALAGMPAAVFGSRS